MTTLNLTRYSPYQEEENGDNPEQWLQDADRRLRSVENGEGRDSRPRHQLHQDRLPPPRLCWYSLSYSFSLRSFVLLLGGSSGDVN